MRTAIVGHVKALREAGRVSMWCMRRKESVWMGSCATVMACTCIGPVLEFLREKNACVAGDA
jgi:hypothetical protein